MQLSKKFSLLSVIICLSIIITSVAYGNENEGYTGWFYPIHSNDTEVWQSYDSKTEKLDLIQIPEDILSVMPTAELVEICLQYPYSSDIFLHNTYEGGLNRVIQDFNGFRELLNREDAGFYLLQQYENTLLDTYGFDNPSQEVEGSLYTGKIILLLSITEIQENLTKVEADVVEDAYYELFDSDVVSYADITVTTPSGKSKVPVLIKAEFSSALISEYNAVTQRDYPNATMIAPSSNKYNCHSYTFYMQSSSNPYWMNDPSAYMSDGSYRWFDDHDINDVWYWPYGSHALDTHSGILKSFTQTVGIKRHSYVLSKWGPGPLMYHKGNDCPYEETHYTVETCWKLMY